MAVRQYIGARYVTKIYENSLDPSSAEWEANVTYEPLTMVTYNNSSYLSKKDVPGSVGNPAANPSYWVVTGAYNGQIAALQSQIDAINARLGKRNFVFLGDSYYVGAAGFVITGHGWAHQVVDYLGLTPDQCFMAEIADMAPEEGSASAPGFYPTTTTHVSFKTELERIAARMTDAEKESITDVVVAGGYNDRNKGGNISTGISEYAAFAKTAFPNATLWVACIGYSTHEHDREWLIDVRSRYRKCIAEGMAYIDTAELVLATDSLFLSDGVHPVDEGYEMIGRQIANALIGGTNTDAKPSTAYSNVGFDSAIVTAHSGSMLMLISDYRRKIFRTKNYLATVSSITLTAGSDYAIEITSCDALQPTDIGFAFQVILDIIHSGGEDHIPAQISFTQDQSTDKKYMNIKTWQTLTSVTKIGFPNLTLITESEWT